jgi:hypothetical protein
MCESFAGSAPQGSKNIPSKKAHSRASNKGDAGRLLI